MPSVQNNTGQQFQTQPNQNLEDIPANEIAEALERADKAGDQESAQKLSEMLAQKRPDLLEGKETTGADGYVRAPKQREEQGQEDKSFLRRTGEAFTSRATAIGAGAMGGGAYGASVGGPYGAVGGSLVGGALGAAGGSITFDSIKNLKAMIEDRPEDVISATEQIKRAGREGLRDLQWGSAGMLAQPIRFSRRLLSRWSGLNSEASRALQRKAKDVGINIGAIDVGGGLPKGWGRSVGVFPITGSPMRKSEIKKVGDIEKAVENIANNMAPVFTTSQAIGTDMFQAARNEMGRFRNVSGKLYDNISKQVQKAAKQAGKEEIIPTENIRSYAESMEEAFKQGEIKLTKGKNKTLERKASQEAIDFIKKLKNLPKNITMEQFERLKREDFARLMSKHAKSNVDMRYLAQAKGALEMDFRNMDTDALPKEAADRIRGAMKAADSFYAKGQTLFSKPAAQKLKRVDKTIFRSGAEQPGSLNADEVYNAAINLKSPDQIRDLTKIVGKENMEKAVRYHWETAVQNARQTTQIMGQNFDVIDPKALEKQLGIYGAKRHQREGVKELYKQANVDFKKVEDLIEVINNLEHIGNAAEFVRRRAILGGIAGGGAAIAGVGGGMAAAGLPGGVITLGGMTLLSRHFSKIFSDPQKIKLMTKALDESLDVAPRNAAYSRLVKMFKDQKTDDEIIAKDIEQKKQGHRYDRTKQLSDIGSPIPSWGNN